jgi:hypothetical protein
MLSVVSGPYYYNKILHKSNYRILWACIFFLLVGNATHLSIKANIQYKMFPVTFELNPNEAPFDLVPFPTVNIATFKSLKATIVEQALK